MPLITLTAAMAAGTSLGAQPASVTAGIRLAAESWPSQGSPVPSVHASTIAEVRDTLVVAWFGGAYESAPNVEIWLSRRASRDDRAAWTQPVAVANGVQPDGRRFPTWNPVLDAPGGARLVLYYKVGPNPRDWWGMRTDSNDGGHTWSTPQRLPAGVYGPIKNKLVRLRDGTLVSGSSTEGALPANPWRVHFERSEDDGVTWQRVSPARSTRDIDAIQPTLLQHSDGQLQALVRTRGPGVVHTTFSTNGGRTWSALTPTALPNPDAGIDAVTLRDGRHVLVLNPVAKDRTPLSLVTSRDGLAWQPLLTLEDGPGEYSYPAIVQAGDGRVHVVYTWRRERIRHVTVLVP
ncbi:exo-alpha-sialidase [Gemmatimonas sp.]